MKSRRRWLWALAFLPVVGLPLIAQETRPPEGESPTRSAPATRESPPATPAEPAPAEAPEPVSDAAPEPADERISADNSLSFPVDI